MRSWSSRLAIALLSLSLVQAGIAACCWTPEAAQVGTSDSCHSTPRSSHVTCAPADAVKGVAAQSTTGRERLPVAGPVPINALKATSPISVVTAAIEARGAAPTPPDDLFLRIHLLLI
jgi:hypothetical protein